LHSRLDVTGDSVASCNSSSRSATGHATHLAGYDTVFFGNSADPIDGRISGATDLAADGLLRVVGCWETPTAMDRRLDDLNNVRNQFGSTGSATPTATGSFCWMT